MAMRLVPSPLSEPQTVDYGASEQHFNEVTFTCHLCNDTVNKSTFLSCLHSFCAECIDERLQRVDTDTLQCPLCPSHDNESSELHTNPLPGLINELKHLKTALVDGTENIRCGDCVFGAEGKTAVAYCVECNATICQIDMRSHEKYNVRHLMLQLDTLQESSVKDILHSLRISKEDPESTSSIHSLRRSRYKLPEDDKSPFSERPDLPIQDECMLGAKSRISELEDRKSDLEKEWDGKASQVVSFFQELYSKLETRQAALLDQLSQMYLTLMTPLQEAIHQLQQTASYTGYVGVLSGYSGVADISERIRDRLTDISMFVANYTAPTDPYSVKVDTQDGNTITTFINNYLKLSKKSIILPTNPFLPKKHKIIELDQEIMFLFTPLDIAINPITDTYYALFGTFWKTYKQINNYLKEKQIIKLTNPLLFPIESSIALLNNFIIIMANHTLYVYSEKGELINQFQMETQIRELFDNPKIYTFTGINSIYIASIESPNVYKVNSHNGTNEGGINLTTKVKGAHYTGFTKLVDMVRSPTQSNQLVILHTTYPTNNPPEHNTTDNQYYIQTYDINTIQFTRVYTLSEKMSPFCCITAVHDALYVLDISTGSVHIYLFSGINQRNLGYSYAYLWSQHSIVTDCIPKCTNIDGKMKRASYVYNQTKKQIIMLSNGKIHIIT